MPPHPAAGRQIAHERAAGDVRSRDTLCLCGSVCLRCQFAGELKPIVTTTKAELGIQQATDLLRHLSDITK